MRLPLLFLALLALSGCQPSIGDSCDVDSDCSRTGERICDSTQPGGYCTIFNCDPTSCPSDESVCVSFGNRPSTVAGCADSGAVSPYARNFCMKQCEDDGDCRDDYACVDLGKTNPWGAAVITRSPDTTKVCVFPHSAELPTKASDQAERNGYCKATMTEGPAASGGTLNQPEPGLGGAGGAGGAR